jgi:predicted lipoprotein
MCYAIDSDLNNTVLCYEANYSVTKISKQTVKNFFLDPALQTLFVQSANLDVLKQNVKSMASKIVLYSNDGLAKINQAKKEVVDTLNRIME